mgnify:FL=1
MFKKTIGLIIFTSILGCGIVFAQAPILIPDRDVFEKAKVITILDTGTTTIPGTDTLSKTQTITIEVLDGIDVGKIATFKNDYVQLEVGDIFYVRHQTNQLDGTEYWSVSEPYRLNIILYLVVAFIVLIFLFGRIGM